MYNYGELTPLDPIEQLVTNDDFQHEEANNWTPVPQLEFDDRCRVHKTGLATARRDLGIRPALVLNNHNLASTTSSPSTTSDTDRHEIPDETILS